MTEVQLKKLHDLFVEHSKHMVEMAYRHSKDPKLAEDLVQEVFLLAAAKPDVVCSHPNPLGWLYKALHNTIYHELRRAYHHQEIPLDDIEGRPEEIAPGLSVSISALLPEGLSKVEKELLLLRIDNGLSYAEIAELKGMQEDNCRKKVSRIMLKCRELLEQDAAGSTI